MTKFFVSTTGSDTNPGTQALPFASLSKACSVLASGDEVEIAAGAYTLQNGSTISGKSNFKIYAAAGAVVNIQTKDTAANALLIENSSDFFVGYLEFSGVAQSVTFAEANNGRTSFQARYDGNGITARNSYDFLIQGCRVQDYPGGGISCIDCDYAQVDRCVVKRCTSYSAWGNQAISFLTAINKPGAVAGAERLKATNNVCYNNVNQIAWTLGGGNGQINEGNGIYSDTTKRSSTGVAYTGTARFEQNLLAFNGSAAIHSLNACPIVVKNNFCAANTRNVETAEIQLNATLSPSSMTNNFLSVTNTSKKFANLIGSPLPSTSGNVIRGTTAQTGVTGSNTFVS
jgi:hypothetical protein